MTANPFHRSRPATDEKPQPIVPAGVSLPPVPHPGRRQPTRSNYLRVGLGDGVDSKVPPPRHAEVPPSDAVRPYDPELADLIDQHAEVGRRYTDARNAVDTGYGDALEQDRAAVEAGTPPSPFNAATAIWLHHRPARIAAAVILAAQVDAHLDAIIEHAAASTRLRESTSDEVDRWVQDAARRITTAARDGDAAALLRVEQELRSSYRLTRALWLWSTDPHRPYQPQRFGLPLPLRDALFNEQERIASTFGGRPTGIFSQLTVSLAAPGGDL